MDDALFVGCRQRRRQLTAQSHRLGHRQLAPRGLDALAQGVALDQLHHQIGDTGRQLSVVGDLDDTWMINNVYGACFIKEARCDLWLLRIATVQDLNRDTAFDRFLHSFIDCAHTTFPDQLDQSVRSDALTLWNCCHRLTS